MIIANGTIQIKIQTGGGLLHGIPQPVKTSWSEPIPANISKSRDDRRGTYIVGTFRQVQATILIEPENIDLFTPQCKRIKVTDNRDEELGEFEVQSITYLEAAQALQLTI